MKTMSKGLALSFVSALLAMALSALPSSAAPVSRMIDTTANTKQVGGLVQKVHGWHCRTRYGWVRHRHRGFWHSHPKWHRHYRACYGYRYGYFPYYAPFYYYYGPRYRRRRFGRRFFRGRRFRNRRFRSRRLRRRSFRGRRFRSRRLRRRSFRGRRFRGRRMGGRRFSRGRRGGFRGGRRGGRRR